MTASTLLTLLAFGLAGLWVLQRELRGLQEVLRDSPDRRIGRVHQLLQETRAELTDLDEKVGRLPYRWEEIYNKARSVEERTRGAIQRARKELAEDGAADLRELDEMGRQLQLGDGVGGEGGGVHPLRAEVEGDPGPPVEDWEARTLNAKYLGIR